MIYHNKSIPIYNIKDFIKEKINELISREQRLSPGKGSGWSISQCNKLILKLNKYDALNAGSYIELPKQIQDMKACIN